MPGFELIDNAERDAVCSIFDEGGVLFAHGFDSIRKRFHVREFESRCCEYFRTKYAHATSSGTAAIKCALKALGVGPGCEVITQGFNFIATVEAIIDCGAEPVICDVDDNLHLDVVDCLSRITSKTKAIIVVNMLGFPGPLNQLSKAISGSGFTIPLVEDACESVGAFVGTKYSGTCADIGVFSFDHGKNLTCGEGGLILTDLPEYSKYVASYSDHGHKLDPLCPRGVDVALMPGFNYRMTEMQAAVGTIQLSKLSRLIRLHKERYDILYRALCSSFPVRQHASPSDFPSYDTFMLLDLDDSLRSEVISAISKSGFATKNIPDAMNWHCSAFWDHALSPSNLEASHLVLTKLSRAVAIPILAGKSLDSYYHLAKSLLQL
jgi:8-amino-3,8-dideoxy-alpha-D-manno-octulosonate transaminase